MIATEILSELEATAKAATPGPWHIGDSMLSGGVWVLGPATDTKSICITGYARDEPLNKKNAAYIAAANPEAVQTLISRLRACYALIGVLTKAAMKAENIAFTQSCFNREAYASICKDIPALRKKAGLPPFGMR